GVSVSRRSKRKRSLHVPPVGNTTSADAVPPAPAPPAPSPAPPSADPSQAAQVPTPVSDAKERREERQFYVDAALKCAQILAFVGSAVWAVAQFQDQHHKDLTQREKELKQAQGKQEEERKQRERALYMKFYEEQRPLYLKVCKAAAEIAAAKRFAD